MEVDKPRILQVIDHTCEGGAQVVVYQYLSWLKNDFSFTVVNLGKEGIFSEAYKQLGISVLELGRNYNRWNPYVFLRLRRVIKSLKSEIVHTHLLKSNLLGSYAAELTNRKFIIHDHMGVYPASLDLYGHYLPPVLIQNIYIHAYRHLIRKCDQVILLNNGMLKSYQDCYDLIDSNIRVLPNAIDVQAFCPQSRKNQKSSIREELSMPANTRIVIMIARLEPEKDWITFLEVSKEFRDAYEPPVAFLIVGAGSEENHLKEYAHENGLRHVFFLGYRDDIPNLLNQSDIFLLTSSREPFGIVVVEAMAAGCPVVATRSGGPEFIIEDGETGLLTDVGDVRGLVLSIQRILEDYDLKVKLSRNARKTVEKYYSIENITLELTKIYNQVLRL